VLVKVLIGLFCKGLSWSQSKTKKETSKWPWFRLYGRSQTTCFVGILENLLLIYGLSNEYIELQKVITIRSLPK